MMSTEKIKYIGWWPTENVPDIEILKIHVINQLELKTTDTNFIIGAGLVTPPLPPKPSLKKSSIGSQLGKGISYPVQRSISIECVTVSVDYLLIRSLPMCGLRQTLHVIELPL